MSSHRTKLTKDELRYKYSKLLISTINKVPMVASYIDVRAMAVS